MTDSEVQASATGSLGLTQLQRITNTFIAPTKVFEDIKRGGKSWWLPFLIAALAGYIFFAAVYTKVGMTTVVDNQIKLDPRAEERMAQASPEQREMQVKISEGVTTGIFVANPLFLLAGIAIMSLGLVGTINFVFAGKAKFGSIFTVWMYASLPGVFKALLGALVLLLGAPPEQFNVRNFAPTNLAAFVYPNAAEANKAIYSLLSSIDVVTIWTLVLLGIGTATVAGVKRSSGYIAVFGWWAIFILFGVGWAAMMG